MPHAWAQFHRLIQRLLVAYALADVQGVAEMRDTIACLDHNAQMEDMTPALVT
jgi:hypothetical protein